MVAKGVRKNLDHIDLLPERLRFNRFIAEWCIRNATTCIGQEKKEQALRWLETAARVMSLECAVLVSPELEKQLLAIGNSLNFPDTDGFNPRAESPRILHVLTQINSDGGHSVMVKRWIRHDPTTTTHNVVLLDQRAPVPEPLLDAVAGRGGRVFTVNQSASLLQRAIRLQEIVRINADVVVLHTHPWDIVPVVAFAKPGGPPVLLLNHAAHIFWVGATISDVVLNCRLSPQEDVWSGKYRGIDQIRHLPIPIEDPDGAPFQEGLLPHREKTRALLGLPDDAVALFTVGIGKKYAPLPGVDFVQTAAEILTRRAKAYLVAVGPEYDPVWEAIKRQFGDRVILVEKQPATSIPVFLEAADLYLEGFPVGSTTALLEAGIRKIPCVLAPRKCPPPFTTDGAASECLEQSTDLPAYIDHVTQLIDNEQERAKCGALFSNAIRSYHCCSEGWTKYLALLQENLPARHEVRVRNHIEDVPIDLALYWSAFSSVISEDPLHLTFSAISYHKLTAKLDAQLLKSMCQNKCWTIAGLLGLAPSIIPAIIPHKLSWLLIPTMYFYKAIRSCIRAIRGTRPSYERESVS